MKKSIKNKLTNFLKKYWISLWIVIATLSLISVNVAYTSYNKTSTAKSVVARVGALGKHFSSNYLQRGSTIVSVPVYVNETDTEPGDYVRIFNFAQGNPGDPYNRQITYVLKMRLVYYNDTDYVPATEAIVGDRYIKAEFNDTTYTFGKDGATYSNLGDWTAIPSSLAGNTASTDTIKVTYSTDQVTALTSNAPQSAPKKLYLEITAEPTPPDNYLDLEKIQARLDLKLNGTVTPVTWKGYFSDDDAKTASDDTALPTTYEGFNYIIEGVGEGSFTLSWKSQYLSLNKDFITASGGTYTPAASNADPKIDTLVFSVDSNNISRYDTQFYRTGTTDPASTWGDLKAYVTYTFAETTSP
ncbi:MAG: hypothetical protein K6G33_11150 [Ruminococcus sp.]|uniref:hypothetical protein n=1 Tax=Ruminococcus sp. TaxID=41978 RepID=UPI0025EBBFF0|nr:hypothetical protein [Ruminococcus sp.]MCR5601282.1 hypothetical protein [Ruminococcus sp.]